MLEAFELTSQRYEYFCYERNYEISDCIRRYFQKEIVRIKNGKSSVDFIYLKLCGDNEDFRRNKLTDEQVKGLCIVLEEDVSVKSLDLRYNIISDEGAIYLRSLLLKNRTIVELNLMGNSIGELGAERISDALASNSTLKILKLTGNKIEDSGAMLFASALQINDSLEEIDLGECDLEIQSVIAFTTMLECNKTLIAINLDRPLLRTQQEEFSGHMEQMLYLNKTLKEIHIAKYEMRDIGTRHICDALLINRSLTVLDLSCNRITRDGALHLAKVLKFNTPLQVLDLGYNRIHDQGVQAIAHSLRYCNTHLKCLVIKYNEIEDDGLKAILTALHENSTLERIYIWGNKFTSKYVELFISLINNFRISESKTDVKPYYVDGKYYFALLNHNNDYRRYRFTAPINGSEIPKNRFYAIT